MDIIEDLDQSDPGTGKQGFGAGSHPAKKKRREYDDEFKRQVVEETLTSQDSVSIIARRYDINTNMLFRWRREYQARQVGESVPSLIPISVQEQVDKPFHYHSGKLLSGGRIQITLSNGHHIAVEGSVDQSQLRWVLQTLSGC